MGIVFRIVIIFDNKSSLVVVILHKGLHKLIASQELSIFQGKVLLFKLCSYTVFSRFARELITTHEHIQCMSTLLGCKLCGQLLCFLGVLRLPVLCRLLNAVNIHVLVGLNRCVSI